MKVIEEERPVCLMDGPINPISVIKDILEEGAQEEPFFVMDLGEVVARYRHWKELMPRVIPFYTVKCNDDKLLVSTLAALGAGFDCASKAEIQLVTSLGVGPDRIIFAHPAKPASHMLYASAVGVHAITFDSEAELIKTKHYMPLAQLVIRIKYDASSAQHFLSSKFGCDPVSEAPRLIKLAAMLGLNVIGVSFHIGSAVQDTAAYGRAIQHAKMLFEEGRTAGHDMRLLDIGGGFHGNKGISNFEASSIINAALETHFPSHDVRVIAEPGRYFAAAAYTLATMIHATKELPAKDGEVPHTMYFINDGVYASFHTVIFHNQRVNAEPLEESNLPPEPCSIWGPSCDSADCILPSYTLPPQRAGNWLIFKDMGAYTLPVATNFNGFPAPKLIRTVVDRQLWSVLQELWD